MSTPADPLQAGVTPIKLSRARLITEFADGSARYFEAREAHTAEIKIDTADDVRRRMYGDSYYPADLLLTPLGPWSDPFQIQGVTLRLTYNPDYHMTINEESGEIPPGLAEALLIALEHGRYVDPEDPRVRIQPCLARIAGRPA